MCRWGAWGWLLEWLVTNGVRGLFNEGISCWVLLLFGGMIVFVDAVVFSDVIVGNTVICC